MSVTSSTTATTAEADSRPVGRPLTTRNDDLRLLAGALVLVLALFADGWTHATRLAEIESFVTPSHVGIFGGFALTATWLAILLQRYRQQRSIMANVPVGYGPAVAGVIAFAAGFLGDGVWHTVFGIEADIDALLSPTHLLMFVGLLGLLTSPWRAAAHRAPLDTDGWHWRGRVPEFGSVVLTTLVVSFFVMYLWITSFGAATRGFADFVAADLSAGAGLVTEISQMAFLGGSYVMTIVLVGAVLSLVRRMPRIPRGSCTVLVGGVGAAMSAIQDFNVVEMVLIFLLAGAASDIVSARAWPTARWRMLAVGVTLPLVLWSAYWVTLAIRASVAWTPELWAGQIVFATLTGVAVTLAMAPPAAVVSRREAG